MSEGSSLIGGGQFTGPSPTPLGSGVARVLGLQGGELGGVPADQGSVQAVFVVGDTSDQLSRALQPRRFQSGAFHVLAAPNVLRWKFRAPSTGSVVIERLRVLGPASAFLTGPIGVNTNAADVFVGFGAFTTIGGYATGGNVPQSGSPNFAGWGAQTQVGGASGFGAVLVPPWAFDGDTFVFLAPGASIGFETSVAGEDVGWFVQWREIPE